MTTKTYGRCSNGQHSKCNDWSREVWRTNYKALFLIKRLRLEKVNQWNKVSSSLVHSCFTQLLSKGKSRSALNIFDLTLLWKWKNFSKRTDFCNKEGKENISTYPFLYYLPLSYLFPFSSIEFRPFSWNPTLSVTLWCLFLCHETVSIGFAWAIFYVCFLCERSESLK
jgi:hypothetical protein